MAGHSPRYGEVPPRRSASSPESPLEPEFPCSEADGGERPDTSQVHRTAAQRRQPGEPGQDHCLQAHNGPDSPQVRRLAILTGRRTRWVAQRPEG